MAFSVSVDRLVAYPGDTVQWTFTYANAGATPVTHVEVFCRLPPQTKYGQLGVSLPQISYPLGVVEAGGVRVMSVGLVVLAAEQLGAADRLLTLAAWQDADNQGPSEQRTVSIPLILPSTLDRIKADIEALRSALHAKGIG